MIWNKLESNFYVQHVETRQIIQIMVNPSDTEYLIYFEVPPTMKLFLTLIIFLSFVEFTALPSF
jgi:hypothetical protein